MIRDSDPNGARPMNAALLLISCISLSNNFERLLPPIVVEDRFLFGVPDRQVTVREWLYLCDLERRLGELRDLNILMRRPTPTVNVIAGCCYAQQAWNLYDNVAIHSALYDDRSADDYCSKAILENLRKLRDLLGPENYYAGRLPDVNWWRRLDAVLNEPW